MWAYLDESLSFPLSVMPHRPTEEHILVPITPPAVTEDRAPAKTNRQDETQNTRISLGKQPGYFDSALEDVESVSSVDLSALSMPTGAERIRRRSDRKSVV